MSEKKYVQLIEQYREQMVEDLQALVRIKSVDELGIDGKPQPFGEGVQQVFSAMLELGKRQGFDTRRVENFGGHIEFPAQEAGEIGVAKPEVMAILGHLDVVPEGSGWEFDPYGAEVKDGRVYGRGTSDNKGPLIAALYAMKAVKEAGYLPRKTVRMILGLDEETNWDGMERYLAEVGAPDFGFTPDGQFPLINGEKGTLTFDIAAKFAKVPEAEKGLRLRSMQGGTAANSVPDFAKALVYSDCGYDDIRGRVDAFCKETGYRLSCKGRGKSLEIAAEGVSAHGATPGKGLNAISVLMEFLGRLGFAGESAEDFIDFYNRNIGFELNGAGMGCGFCDDISGELVWNTGVISLNEEAAQLTINIRYPISCSDEKVYDAMMPLLNARGYGVVKKSHNPPIYLPEDHPIVQALMASYQEFTGDLQTKPLVIGGASYARAIPNAVAFGMLFPDEEDIMHQKNESISIDNLVKAAKIYAEAIVRLSDAVLA